MRKFLSFFLLSLFPFAMSCGLCCDTCLHPVQTANKAAEVGRRINPKQRAQNFKGVVEEGSMRDKDFGAYVGFVVSELRLKDVLAVLLHDEKEIKEFRVQTVDAFSLPDGTASVVGRLEVVPDYGVLVNEGVKLAFGIWGKLLPDALVKKVGRDLASGNRFVAQFLDVGVDESDLEFFLITPAGEVALGKGMTDVGGRATLAVPAGTMANVPSGAYAVSARLSNTHRPIFYDERSKVSVEDGGMLFVRRPADPPQKVVIVNVSNTVFALADEKSMRKAVTDKKYELRDACVKPALQGLAARGYRVVFLSGNPEGMAPLMREELAKSDLLGTPNTQDRAAPLVFKPMSIGMEKSAMRQFKAQALKEQAAHWGPANITGYIADDEEDDGAAALEAGVPYLQLPSREKGGWCAGISGLVPAATKAP